ncbi:hypothetical protein M422DRAFT_42937 [Sphaerobolus stellatus SS14]|nr:hypothetical protein M422DRAFT_42937 [Sphaerobolus stellatus SS14]
MDDDSLPTTPLSTALHFRQERGYHSQEMFNTVLWLLDTSNDTEAIDSSLEWITDRGDWVIDAECANHAMNMLKKFLEVSLSKISFNRAVQCLQGIYTMIALGGMENVVFEQSGDVLSFMTWLGQCYRDVILKTGDLPFMEGRWRILRLPPYLSGGDIKAEGIDSGTIALLRISIQNNVRHLPGALLSIEVYASLFSYILQNSAKVFGKGWCILNISGIIAGILGLQVPEFIDHFHDTPLCDEILLRLSRIFTPNHTNQDKRAGLLLLYPFWQIIDQTPGALNLYNMPSAWQSRIPTSLWLNHLREGHHWIAICASVQILGHIVFTENRESPFNRI